ncbi:ABC transporter ATP-binding protein [Thermodesulfobacteriota bacterium]
MNENIIEIENIDRNFRHKTVLKDLNLSVPGGIVYGLLGRNGVGKTTTIRILLGLLFPDRGQTRVLGMNSQKNGENIRQKVGYVAEGQQLYQWMRIEEILWFNGGFYRNWDADYAGSLIKRFELDPKDKIGNLSRGMLSKLSLTLALGHRPKLLILDEATAGLDAIVRREFLDSIVELVNSEGHSVLISSHLLSDMERVVDQIGILRDGHITESGNLEDFKGSYRKVKLSFDEPPGSEFKLPDTISEKHAGREVLFIFKNYSGQKEKELNDLGPKNIEFIDMSLEDLFTECLVPPKLNEEVE